jgi:uncharacterized protein YbjT (DUF2867 family)
MTIALTGTTGNVGGKVLARLGGEHVLIGRDVSKLPVGAAAAGDVQAQGHDRRQAAYGDTDAMTTALAGVDTLFFVSGRESAARLDEHLSVVDAAVAAGVDRIVYLSFLGNSADSVFTLGRHHFFTEQRILASGLEFTFLRDSLYQDFLPFMADAAGVIRGPAGDGRVSAVSSDDVADVAAAVLRAAEAGDTRHDGAAYSLTGPAALTLDEVAATLAAVSAHPVTYVRETEAEAYASREKFGAPAFEVEGWVTSYQAIAAGEVSAVSDDVERVAGHPPQSFAGFLVGHPESWAHLVG